MGLLIVCILGAGALLWPRYANRATDRVSLAGFLAFSIAGGCALLLAGFVLGQMVGTEIMKVAGVMK
jgi:hypothetical protein